MPYLLRPAIDPRDKTGLIYSTGPDDLSCQAEVLALFRKSQSNADVPKGQILGMWKIDPAHAAGDWLALFPEDDRERIRQAKVDIQEKGWASFHHGALPLPKHDGGYLLGRTPPESVLLKGSPEYEKEMSIDVLRDALTNPLHVGIHPDFKATVPDELWLQAAVKSLKSTGAEKWLTLMIDNLRSFFGGMPKIPIPNKNDVCPCKSGKKYGKCCGEGVQDEDPEDCKLGKHDFADGWAKSHTGKFIRGCARCMKIEEAPYGEEVEIQGGPKAALIGCKTCSAAPTVEDARKLVERWNSLFACSFCGKPIALREVVVSHHYRADGTHKPEWKLTRLLADLEFTTFRQTMADGGARILLVHGPCLATALPYNAEFGKLKPEGDEDDHFLVASSSV